MHTKKQKKNIPLPKQLQSDCFPCAQNHAPVTKISSRQTTQQIASSTQASPTFGHANANLNDYHYSFL